MRYFVSGGAPLAPEIDKFFFAAGLVILEGYGLTETSPVIAVNTPEHFRIGTVGKPVAGVEVKIASDGEILTRGPHVMKGYFNKPEATARGDRRRRLVPHRRHRRARDGFLAITDRKKDIIVTAGGKNVAPQPIENNVKTNTFVSQAVMLGDKRKFPVMLVVPNWDSSRSGRKLKNISGPTAPSCCDADLAARRWRRRSRSKLTGLAHFEMPKKIGLLEHDFSVERGELTPTLKVKRRVIEDYEEQIDALYADAD